MSSYYGTVVGCYGTVSEYKRHKQRIRFYSLPYVYLDSSMCTESTDMHVCVVELKQLRNWLV